MRGQRRFFGPQMHGMRRRQRIWILCAAGIASAMASPAAWAGNPLDPGSLVDPTVLLTPSLVNATVRAMGLATDHRAYEPATPLGTSLGVDISLEATLTKLSREFFTELEKIGNNSLSSTPNYPVFRLNLHKGLGPSFDFGASLIFFDQYRTLGFEVKIPLSLPEEGPNWALRLSYTNYYFSIENGAKVELSTKTFTPQIVISRPLEFAEPYLGVGYQYSFGTVTVTVPLTPLPSLVQSQGGRGGGGTFFTGVGLKIPNTGLKITIEGAYSTADILALGTKVGFAF